MASVSARAQETDVIQRTRHVFHIAGYDPVSARNQHQRFLRQLTIFKRTWNVAASATDLENQTSMPNWRVTAEGPNWQVESSVELLAWDDLVNKDAGASRIVRLLRALIVYSNLLLTGTLLRYAIASPRYFLFAMAPLIETILLGILSWSVAFFLVSLIGWPPPVEYSLAVAGGFVAFLLLLEWPGRRWRIYQALDDWILSLDYVYGKRPDLEARLDHFANRIVSEATSGHADEIVVVGHSLGATFALDAVARALAIDPDLGRHGHSIAVVTVGATIPKCALHPAAHRLRDRIREVVNELSVHWVEYQSRQDAISFYRFDPVTLKRLGAVDDKLDGRPLIRRVQAKNMLQPATFAKYRLRVLRLHYQVVMGNERRASYDYFMMICGPLLVKEWTTSRLGLLDFFGEAQNATVVQATESAS
jgi:hypothetical protein